MARHPKTPGHVHRSYGSPSRPSFPAAHHRSPDTPGDATSTRQRTTKESGELHGWGTALPCSRRQRVSVLPAGVEPATPASSPRRSTVELQGARVPVTRLLTEVMV